jgi:serine/threonine protein kinase
MDEDLIGEQLGNYRLMKLLGSGGFASVYLGQHVDIPTLQAAIKILHLTKVDTQKFRQEATIIAALKHPHIIRLSDFSDRQEMPFLVMDYAPNGSLWKRHPLGDKVPLATIVQYTKQIADALQYAHKEYNVIHRDIKPDNVLIGTRGELLLSDFGIAVISKTGQTTLNTPYGIAGTPYYMAPEMFKGKPDKASDQYALAVMVYQWLSGTLPFDQGDWMQLGYQHTHEAVPPLRERVPLISRNVETMVMTALAKDPKKRFATIQEFATALWQASQTKQTIHGHPPSRAKSSRPKSSPSPREPAPQVTPIVTQPAMDMPVEQHQPSMPKQPKQSQIQAKPQSPMPKRSRPSSSVSQRKSESLVWKAAVIATMVAAMITGAGVSLLNMGLISTIMVTVITATGVASLAIEILGSKEIKVILGLLGLKEVIKVTLSTITSMSVLVSAFAGLVGGLLLEIAIIEIAKGRLTEDFLLKSLLVAVIIELSADIGILVALVSLKLIIKNN